MKWFITQIALGLLWCGKRFATAIVTNWPVIFRASLYFLGAFVVALSEKLCAILFNDVWPSRPYSVGSFLAAFGVSLIALRAFYDGAAQRHADAHENDSASTVTRTTIQQAVVKTTPPGEPPKP